MEVNPGDSANPCQRDFVALEPRHVSRQGVLQRLDITGEEGGDARSGHWSECAGLLFPGRLAAPPGIIAGEFEAITFGKADQLVRPVPIAACRC